MSGWGDLTSLAKSALTTAQKVREKVDRVLDIQDPGDPKATHDEPLGRLQEDFFTAFGLTPSRSDAEIPRDPGGISDERTPLPTSSTTTILTDVANKLRIGSGTNWSGWLPASSSQVEETVEEAEVTTNVPGESVLRLVDEKDLAVGTLMTTQTDEIEDSVGWTNDGWNSVELTASRTAQLADSVLDDVSLLASLNSSASLPAVLMSSSLFSSDLSSATVTTIQETDPTIMLTSNSSVTMSVAPPDVVTEESAANNDADLSQVELLLRGVVEKVGDIQRSSPPTPAAREDLKILLPPTSVGIVFTTDPSAASEKDSPLLEEEAAISPASSDGCPRACGSDDSSGGRNDGSGSTADFDVQKDSGSTGFTSPMLEEVDLASMSDDIEILSRCTTTPNGSEFGSIRSGGFVFTPAAINLPSVGSAAGLEESDSTAILSPLKRHLASIQQALGTRTEKSRKHRRVNSDQMGKESLRTVLSGIPMDSSAEETIDKLTKCVAAREQKLLSVSQENARLTEENEKLRREVEVLKAQTSLGGITDLEGKYVNLCEEREALKRKCESLQRELVARVSSQQFQHAMREKEDQIQQLLDEGQKLSKREFHQATVIKKLREKEKEADKLLEAQKSRLKELDDVKVKLVDSQYQIAKYEDLVAKMESAAERTAKQTTKLQAEVTEAGEKLLSYKATLESCYKDAAEWQKDKVALQTQLKEMRSEAESSEREELRVALERTAVERDGERHRLAQQLAGLELNLTQSALEHSRKEDSLRWEISRLQKQLQEADSRNESLSESATTATRPLLRQIESLQNSFKTQQENWERLEKSLYDRIAEAEAKANQAGMTEKSASAEASDLRRRLRADEAQISALTTEKSQLAGEILTIKKDSDKMAEENKRLTRELEAEKNLERLAVAELKKEKELLNAQMEFDAVQTRSQCDARLKDLQIALEDKDKLLAAARSQLLDQQVNRSITSGLQIDTSPSRFSVEPPPQLIRVSSFDDQGEDLWKPSDLTGGSFSTLLENLRGKLQQRDSEVNSLRTEIRRLLQSRDQLISQLTYLSSQVDRCEGQLGQFASLQQQFNDLTTSHQALLQLYGEKVERTEELQLDLEDVKVMYRQQIEDLLAKLTG